jgi:chemotaxis response regulator CheB
LTVHSSSTPGASARASEQAVKAHGGRVIAQDPSTALYSSMPRSAVETGAVDYVLPLAAIAPAIAAIVRGEPVLPAVGLSG